MRIVDLAKNSGFVLDGAMSYELEHRGVDTDNKLWTATALINQLEKVYQAHMDYFKAGARLVITDTYQANVQAFEKEGYSEAQAITFIKNAVKIAKKARDDFENKTGRHNYVAATIGPHGAYLADGNEYRGDYHLSQKEFLTFHLPRLKAVLAEKPDVLAIETQPRLDEPVVLLDWLKKNKIKIPVYISFTLKNAKQISDGISLKEAVSKINQYDQVFAVGVNCVNPKIVTAAVDEINKYTNKAIIVYPNLGVTYDPKTKQWAAIKEHFDFGKLAREWYQHGARIIGGCCTTGPKQIAAVNKFYQTLN